MFDVTATKAADTFLLQNATFTLQIRWILRTANPTCTTENVLVNWPTLIIVIICNEVF